MFSFAAFFQSMVEIQSEGCKSENVWVNVNVDDEKKGNLIRTSNESSIVLSYIVCRWININNN